MPDVWPGAPFPLGATWNGSGTNFSLFSENATRVELALTRQPGGVLLRIADDGRGLDGAAEGAGIRGMRERAILIGAALQIEGRSGGGTDVRLLVPS